MKLVPIAVSDFDLIYSEMEKNFVIEERRDKEEARKLLSNPLYTAYHVEKDGKNIGFITVWQLKDITFAEHFVIYEEYRNCGCGKDAIGVLCDTNKKVFLEAEPPYTEIASRRLGFYARCGFVKNDIPYMQPPYRENESGVELVLLSYPEALKDPKATVKELYKTVYNRNLEE